MFNKLVGVYDIETVKYKNKEIIYSLGIFIGNVHDYIFIEKYLSIELIYKIYKQLHIRNFVAFNNLINQYFSDQKDKMQVYKIIKQFKIFNFFVNNKPLNKYQIYEQLLLFLAKQQKENIQIYALNGSCFDAYILIDELCKYTENLVFSELIMITKIYNFTLKILLNTNRQVLIKFRDILNITGSFSLKRLCNDLNIPNHLKKIDDFNIIEFRNHFKNQTLNEQHVDSLFEYLTGDIFSLFLLIQRIIQEFSNSLDIDITKYLTIGAISYESFKKYIRKNKIKIVFTTAIDHAASIRESLYGGRVYCLKPYGTNLVEYDVNSLYPAAMSSFEYPTGNTNILVNPTSEQIEQLNEKLFIACVEISICPDKLKQLNISPIQNFEPYPEIISYFELNKTKYIKNKKYTFKPFQYRKHLFLTSVDIQELEKYNYKVIHYHLVYYWESKEKIFTEYINKYYKQRKKAKKEENRTLDLIYKLLMNSLYGKLCQRPETKTFELVNNAHQSDIQKKLTDHKTLSDFRGIQKGNYILVYKESIKKIKYPTHLACFILAYSRKIMNNIFDHLGGFTNPRWYYSDTDSIYIDKKDINILEQHDLIDDFVIGKLRKVNQYTECVFAGNKIKALRYKENNSNIIKELITCRGFSINKINFNDIYNFVFYDYIPKYLETVWKKSLIDGFVITEQQKILITKGPSDAVLDIQNNKWVY